MNDANARYSLLKTPENNPIRSQRYLAKRLGVSFGKISFCLNALVEKDCLKVNNFRNSDNKLAYAYTAHPARCGREGTHDCAFSQTQNSGI